MMTEPNRRISDRMRPEEIEVYTQCPRFDKHELSEGQIADIAESAAHRAVAIAREQFYKDVGQTVVSKWLVIIGMMTVGLYTWLKSKGVI